MDRTQTFFFGRSLYHAQYLIEDPVFGETNPEFGCELYSNFLADNPGFDPFAPEPIGSVEPDYFVNVYPYGVDPSHPPIELLYLRQDIFAIARQMFFAFSQFGWDAPYIAPRFFLGENAAHHSSVFFHPHHPDWGFDLSRPHLLQHLYCRCLLLFGVTASDLFSAAMVASPDTNFGPSLAAHTWEILDLFFPWEHFPILPAVEEAVPHHGVPTMVHLKMERDLFHNTLVAYAFHFLSPYLFCVFRPRSR